jgi:glutamate synthase (ferredoxin)
MVGAAALGFVLVRVGLSLHGRESIREGPRCLVKERDACGVGFVADIAAAQKGEFSGSRAVMDKALEGLACMEHRGACSADGVSGDGAGIMSTIPWELFEADTPAIKGKSNLGCCLLFLPTGSGERVEAKAMVERLAVDSGLTVVAWRDVPVDRSILGVLAEASCPTKEMVFLSGPDDEETLESTLYLFRRATRGAADQYEWAKDYYVASCSSRTIVYKGMVQAGVLPHYYLDLQNPLYKALFVVFHRRFSTNTMPKWPLAQPMRCVAHNGEINTLLGNVNWVRARQAANMDMDLGKMVSCEVEDNTYIEDDRKAPERVCEEKVPLGALVNTDMSDSANLASVAELYMRSGRSIPEAFMVLVPEAHPSEEVKKFYQFHAPLQEPWDGPALLTFADGKHVGATLDRNGLRPARYTITKDGLIVMCSEAGAITIPSEEVAKKGRLGPGKMIAVDLKTGEFMEDNQVKQKYGALPKWAEKVAASQSKIEKQDFGSAGELEKDVLIRSQIAFGWGSEDIDMQIADACSTGKEATFSMGDDTPLPVLSRFPHPMYNYFKQRFAQVTNPPIDSLREGSVMNLDSYLGARGHALDSKKNTQLVKLDTPLMNQAELDSATSKLTSKTLPTVFDRSLSLDEALDNLCNAAVEAAEKHGILILSDREILENVQDYSYIPPLLATGAVHYALLRSGCRLKTSLVIETGQAWSTHHFCCLAGYGAQAIHPYLAIAAVHAWHEKKGEGMEREQAFYNWRKAMNGGLLKILSKIGISTLASYTGAQLFEAIGINGALIDRAFSGTPSRLGGLDVPEFGEETERFLTAARGDNPLKIANYGFIMTRKNREYHSNAPHIAKLLQTAVKESDKEKRDDLYTQFVGELSDRSPVALRDLTEFVPQEPIPLEEVEPIESIMERFCTGAMSLGALSREAHETLAIAMNRMGAKSNCGEGGEDKSRYTPIDDVKDGRSERFPHLKDLRDGDTARSKIKQVSSGRFGVTPMYVATADSLEIKVAQGAKPGEGGQLPGTKVDKYISGVRGATEGVTLISPPPHHDIYGIEDLAELIHDLKSCNPSAPVSVKLVASVGIGTVACGVAKCNADVIQISGHDGGTGASPLSSLKHAGAPWELGLADAHRSLVENGLRDRSLLRVDGGLRTGLDIVQAALLGAEEFGFGTVAMIAEGCIMARVCHTNKCPVGVTTQREVLRKRFPGTPEHVVNYFALVAEDVRHILASLGLRTLREAVGRADLLKQKTHFPEYYGASGPHVDGSIAQDKPSTLCLDFVLDMPELEPKDRARYTKMRGSRSVEDGPGGIEHLDDRLIKELDDESALLKTGIKLTSRVSSVDRAVGARLAGVLAKRYGDTGIPGVPYNRYIQTGAAGGLEASTYDKGLQITYHGSAGQSFGAFCVPGMRLELIGEANDYSAKGMHGGTIVMKRPAEQEKAGVILGNTTLYGATGGCFFAAGMGGERFAVRNSGAIAVIEGTGDHCCEYMTNGAVVSLGPIGMNAAAGMTGGVAYFLDEGLNGPINTELVEVLSVAPGSEAETELRSLIEAHVTNTDSERGKMILEEWDTYLPKFVQLLTQGAKMKAAADAVAAEVEKAAEKPSSPREKMTKA